MNRKNAQAEIRALFEYSRSISKLKFNKQVKVMKNLKLSLIKYTGRALGRH